MSAMPVLRKLRAPLLIAAVVAVPAFAQIDEPGQTGAPPPVTRTVLEFMPATPTHRNAAGIYAAIWDEFGDRIVLALEARTCLPFSEPRVSAMVDDATSHSAGPEHPMQLRATYPLGVKRATLVHELGHRHLWQLEERPDDIDSHQLLYLILDRVWADVWGEDFAASRIRDESAWRNRYDYAEAWSWAAALDADERDTLWSDLLRMNEIEANC
jgi:hypothetical protein